MTTDSETNFLKDLIRCSMCRFVPTSCPIFQCAQGHPVCESCTQRVITNGCQECSECGSTVTSGIRCLIAEQILKRVPIPCTFESQGCNVISMGEELDAHEADCCFRPLPCAIPTCVKSIPINHLIKHIDQDHLKSHTFMAEGACLSHYLHVDDAFFERASWWKPTVLNRNGKYFLFLCHRTVTGQWTMWVYFVGSQEDSLKYQYEIMLISSHDDEELFFKGKTVHLSVTKEEVSVLGYGLLFSDEAAKRFWNNEDKKIKFRVAVSERINQIG